MPRGPKNLDRFKQQLAPCGRCVKPWINARPSRRQKHNTSHYPLKEKVVIFLDTSRSAACQLPVSLACLLCGTSPWQVAERTLEQYSTAVLEHTLAPPPLPKPEFRAAMQA